MNALVRNEAIVFVSATVAELSPQHLTRIMSDAARFNREAGVNGVTLFDGARFLSYLEGTTDNLSAAFLRASASTSHTELVILADGRIGPCRLPHWPMRCLQVAPEELKKIARSDWYNFDQSQGDRTSTANPSTRQPSFRSCSKPSWTGIADSGEENRPRPDGPTSIPRPRALHQDRTRLPLAIDPLKPETLQHSLPAAGP